MTRLDRSALALAVSLSGLAGYVDALGFLKLGGYFVSFMSGNSTQVGVDIIQKGPWLPLGLIIGFVAGVIGGSWVGRLAGSRRQPLVLAMGAENTVFEEDGEVRFGLTYVTGSLVKMGQRIASALLGGKRADWVPYFLLWAGLVGGALAGAASYLRWGLGSLWMAGTIAALLTSVAAASPRPKQ